MDPLQLRNYGQEDFAKAAPSRPMTGLRMQRDVFGKADPYREYMEEFEKAEHDHVTSIVRIPRYMGTKSTRCDKYTSNSGNFQVRGIVSHLQKSSVYLHQTFKFKLIRRNNLVHSRFPKFDTIDVPPFFIQRQWNKLQFSAPQSNNRLEMDSRCMVKLAPYLSSAKCMENLVKTKINQIKTN